MKDYLPLVYCHEPSEEEARPSLMWMLGGHYSCNIGLIGSSPPISIK
jgi:hypothetical protein